MLAFNLGSAQVMQEEGLVDKRLGNCIHLVA